MRCARTFFLNLHSGDIRSEGSIAIVKKNRFRIFNGFPFYVHPHILKKCFRKNVCLCVCVCVCVCPSPNVEPKPIDRSHSKSISSVFSQISEADFLVFPLPLKLRVVHIRKILKFLTFSKMAPTILIKFSGLTIAYIKNPTTRYCRLYPEKSLKLEKIFF